MKKLFVYVSATAICLALASLTLCAQETGSAKQSPSSVTAGNGTAVPAVVITSETSPLDLAKTAFGAHGGEKLRNVQNMILRGSAQLYPPNSVQSIPGSFSLITAGPKLRLEIDARPVIVFKQIYDGQQSYSSMPNVEMPPLTKFGLSALVHFDQPGYQVTAIPDKKKQRGFRIVDPEGYTTDFYLDSKTGRVANFFLYHNGVVLGTENSKFKEIEGVLVPSSFSQKFEMPMGAFFAEFSVKEVKLNQTLGDDAFAIPR
jgi:hypothetical protein